jgi:uncharacterized repeat protein (TIGR03837 family)
MRWDVFCRVVDNYGDVGVAWRLAGQLGARGESVRLWLDDARALAWMAPAGAPGVSVQRWADAAAADPADVALESFGGGLPDAYVERMAAQPRPPLWVNLEYLSAERYVERSHGLPSPRSSGPGAGLTTWFYFPGFTPASGGLLREPDLMEQRGCFDRRRWLQALATAAAFAAARPWPRSSETPEPRPGERVVSLFCYDNPALPALLETLASAPTLLLVTDGPAARQVEAVLGPAPALGGLRTVRLPLLSQVEYDHLLWACDLNFVRGEDSFVRAQWAGAPFVWQPYPQADGAHLGKLDAFLDRFLAGASGPLAVDVRGLHAAWNGASAWPNRLPDAGAWGDQCARWRAGLLAQADLCSRLLEFVAEKR